MPLTEDFEKVVNAARVFGLEFSRALGLNFILDRLVAVLNWLRKEER